MRRYLYIVGLWLACVVPAAVSAQELDSTLTVSLLTCSPGQLSYELYGHTALRVRSAQTGADYVFNYGAFDFKTPNFTWRFILGETDYMLGVEPFDLFMAQYRYRGSSVTEQVLNLLPWEANRLALALKNESHPDSCVYRYNIFRNNCTTRARDVVEAAVAGEVVYPIRGRRNTFRTILHEFTAGHEWAREGNDLLLGADVDTLITERDEMFAPLYLMDYFAEAMVAGYRRNYRPLVCETRELLPENSDRQREMAARLPATPVSPRALGWVLLAVGLLLAVWEWHRRRILWPVDTVLLTLQGLAGLLLAFMAMFSQHPGVASNWQVMVLNPVPLFFVWSVMQADRHRESHVYHAFAAGFLTLFIPVYFLIPQDFSWLILPLALLLLSRALLHIVVYK